MGTGTVHEYSTGTVSVAAEAMMTPLYRNLSQQLADCIDQGVYAFGERMPGLRQISKQRKAELMTQNSYHFLGNSQKH